MSDQNVSKTSNPQHATVELGHASDTTLARSGAGDVTIEGNAIHRADGADVPIGDGGTGQSTAQAAIDALSAVSAATNEHVLTKDTGSGNAIWKVAAGGGDDEKVGVDAAATPDYLGVAAGDGVLRVGAGLSYADGGDFVTVSPDLKGDGTAGRAPRMMELLIEDGTNANTIKCTLTARWNGDSDGPTDNVAKGATTGNFTLAADGKQVTIEAAALSGDVLGVFGVNSLNGTGTYYLPRIFLDGVDIAVDMRNLASSRQDLTLLADVGNLRFELFYITDA